MSATPGPWFAEPRYGGFINIVHPHKKKGSITRVLCRVQSRDSWIAESQANARLMAAAWDMLEVLKDVHPYIVGDAMRLRVRKLILAAT